MLDSAWFCGFHRCEVAYFNQFGGTVTMDELNAPVYPYDINAPICACFGLTYDDVVADADDTTPKRIREVHAATPRREKPSATCWPPTAAPAWPPSKNSTCGYVRKTRAS